MFTSLLQLMVFRVCNIIIQYLISHLLLKPGYRCLGMAPSAIEKKLRVYMYTLNKQNTTVVVIFYSLNQSMRQEQSPANAFLILNQITCQSPVSCHTHT